MDKVKGVIFDFNGTLFWDTPIHNKAWDIFLETHGIRLTDNEKNKIIHGKNNRDILTGLFGNQLTVDEMLKLSAKKEKIYRQLCLQTDIELAPGAEDMLQFLSVNRIAFTIATASEKDNVDFYFSILPLNTYFDKLKIIFNDGTLKSKPHPQIFQKALDELKLSSSETIIFEDSYAGISAAENAGVSKIIIVNSTDDDYSRWNYQTIKNFNAVDRRIFE
jgi:HAD superfamily hydrolase (TIGR01509 family)